MTVRNPRFLPTIVVFFSCEICSCNSELSISSLFMSASTSWCFRALAMAMARGSRTEAISAMCSSEKRL